MKYLLFVLVLLISSCSSSSADIRDFDSCVSAGFPVMESYPEQCRGPRGEVFVNQIEEIYCTQEVQECSDGSFVSRDPLNNCEFKACQ